MRKTVFHGTKGKFVQAVINDCDSAYMLGLGFVLSADDLKDDEVGSDREAFLRAELKKLGRKPGGRSSLETLEKQYAELSNDTDEV